MTWKKRFYDQLKKGDVEEEEKNDARSQVADDATFEKYQKMKLSGEIKEGFALYFKNLPKLIFVFCGLALITSLLSVIIFTNIDWQLASEYNAFQTLVGDTPQEDWTEEQITIYLDLYNRISVLGFVEAIFKFIPFVLGGMMVGYFLIDRLRGNPGSLKISAGKVFSVERFRPLLLHTIILTIMISFGLSFLLIPGFLFIMALGFMFFIIPEYKEKLLNYPRLAYMLGEKNRLRTFALAIIGYAFYAFFGYLLGALATWFYTQDMYLAFLNPVTRNYAFLLYFEVVELTLPALFQPLLFCFLAVQYIEFNIKKEIALGDLPTLISAKPEPEPGEKSEPLVKYSRSEKRNFAKVIQQKDKEARYYCPGCGQRVLPTVKQTTVRCKNCDLEVHIPIG
jgi:hypothetical protein